MANPGPVDPVKYLVAILWREKKALEEALECLQFQWGPVDTMGRDHPFNVTEYYECEMGTGIKRRLISFAKLKPPEEIREAKLACNKLERSLAEDHRRRVNLDIGYLDHNKIVLASLKYAGQKIHLGDGVYADLIARYRNRGFRPLEWTFPDFRDGRYDAELLEIRRNYLIQLRHQKAKW